MQRGLGHLTPTSMNATEPTPSVTPTDETLASEPQPQKTKKGQTLETQMSPCKKTLKPKSTLAKR